MKSILGRIFALIFKIFSLWKIHNNKITFIMTHDDKFNGNIKYVYEQIKLDYPNYKINVISRKDYSIRKIRRFKDVAYLFIQVTELYLRKNYHLATSKYIFLNNIFITGAYLKFKKDVKVIQLWHAIGTFKKFGEEYAPSVKLNELQKKANSIYTDLVVCSSKDISIYAKAFNVKKDKIKVVGSPNCDLFHNSEKINNIKKSILKQYPQIKNKRIILYAPTFRDEIEDNKKVLEYVNIMAESIDENCVVLLRLHPHIYKQYEYGNKFNNIIDMSGYEDVNELMLISDLLITDYSSLFYEYSYLEKPIIFFAFDLKRYEKSRGFYYDYTGFVPGEVIYEIKELINKINSHNIVNRSIEFKKEYFNYVDGKSSDRVLSAYLE
ncbi:CDP-ribitol ribitolphosphotransferase [Clostridium sp. DL-VIII]|uniref:CDP-glycerol glycerophosphotransferase family protein n=1 Tax=Clostridium sp. DL-VIII TaxID=641107 RepID=UPI00023B0732|nr:CDP-glycerol glycerophosphotransferase family protein [Clostridium sp. DL-VIII]EHJ02131.1 CDP-ribitol ribitolphosphotransferase [Clostridium sp. DL-VIII]